MFKKIWAALVAAFKPVPLGQTFTGRVCAVIDGDTLEVRCNWQSYRIRLAGIDAPETRQRFGVEATRYLAAIAYGRTATVERCGVDRFGRMLARVSIGGEDVALSLLEAGLAWHNRAFSSKSIPQHAAAYGRAAGIARIAGKGLWSELHVAHPAQFRRREALAKNHAGQGELFR